MFNKILVAIDGSAMSDQVVEKAIALAQLTHASLLLLHVISLDEAGTLVKQGVALTYYKPKLDHETTASYLQQFDSYRSESLDLLRLYANQARAAGLEAEFAQRLGGPSRTICQMAFAWGADLIVLGRRGLSGLGEMALGSVSNAVVHHAPCTVLTVQPISSTSTKSMPAQVTETIP